MTEKVKRKKPAETGVAECFKTRAAALDWLRGAGYKVSVGKFYTDTGAGTPPVNRDGSISKAEVMQYAATLDCERRPSLEDADLAQQRELAEVRKAVADAAKAEMAVDELHRQADAKWISRVESVAQMAALVGSLRDVLLHHFHLAAPSLAKLVDGDPALAPQLYEGAEELIAKAYNELAAGEIDVELEDFD